MAFARADAFAGFRICQTRFCFCSGCLSWSESTAHHDLLAWFCDSACFNRIGFGSDHPSARLRDGGFVWGGRFLHDVSGWNEAALSHSVGDDADLPFWSRSLSESDAVETDYFLSRY